MIVLKRFLLFTLVVAMASIFLSCHANKDYTININGRYAVTEEKTGIAFIAEISDHGKRIVFTAPSTLAGVKAYSNDGNAYTVEYENITDTLGAFSIKTATDLFSALEALNSVGKYNGSTLSVSLDNITVKGIIENKCITEISYSDGMHERKYKIKTEATE